MDTEKSVNRLNEKLLEQYDAHYSAVNVSTHSAAAPDRYYTACDLMYGELLASLPEESAILDVGCGTGFLLSWLSKKPGIKPVGVDASANQVTIAQRQLPGVEITLSDGCAFLRKHPDAFQGIFCFDIIEHVPDDALIDWMESVYFALKKGGFFCCRVPNAANLTGHYSRYLDMTHHRCFTKASLFQLLRASQFSHCRILPIRSAHMTGRIRLLVETWLHTILFRICGRGLESCFTSSICAVGFRS